MNFQKVLYRSRLIKGFTDDVIIAGHIPSNALIAYVDGYMSSADREIVQDHIRECRLCLQRVLEDVEASKYRTNRFMRFIYRVFVYRWAKRDPTVDARASSKQIKKREE
jgi:anti-sigma factor RsiW